MVYKVKCKQVVSNHCFICGEKNQKGLKLPFYVLENGEIAAVINSEAAYNSYPGYMHGGVSAAILDETIGRAVEAVADPTKMAVTVDLRIKYRKPAPIGARLICIGRKTEETSRGFYGTGEIYGPDGSVLVTAEGTYYNIDFKKMFSDDTDFLYQSEIHPELEYIEIPDKN